MAWEVNFKRFKDTKHGRSYWARNLDSPTRSAQTWHWARVTLLREAGVEIPRCSGAAWQIDWSHAVNTGTHVRARNLRSKIRSAREWHMVATGYLRAVGVNTPVYRKESWEVDWSKRNKKLVWARNVNSKMPGAREWHWVQANLLKSRGILWRPAKEYLGRTITGSGYVVLSRRGMTEEEIELAWKHRLWFGRYKAYVSEHRLVAVKKYGGIPSGIVVRHLNGIKTDNRPDNLVLGTHAENQMDHRTARVQAMYWRERYEALEKQLAGSCG